MWPKLQSRYRIFPSLENLVLLALNLQLPTASPWQGLICCHCNFAFLRISYKLNHRVYSLLCLTPFIQHVFEIFLLYVLMFDFCCWVIFHCIVWIYKFDYQFTNWPILLWMILCEYLHINLCADMFSFLFDKIPKNRIVRSCFQ